MNRFAKFVAHGGIVLALVVAQALLIAALMVLPVTAAQNPLSSPTTGTVSGLQVTNNFNNALDSLNTCNSGGTAPTNQLSGAPSASNCWDDTSTAGWIKRKVYDGAQWIVSAYFDLTNHLYVGIIGGGAVNNVASAATTDLCGSTQFPAYMNVTGTTTITSFGSSCQTGQWKRVQFTGVLTLTYNAASLILPTAANITTAAGDTADLVYLGSGNWIVFDYSRATGAALSTVGLSVGASALGNSSLGFNLPVNLGITASVASNALTVNITGADGSVPSSLNPVLIPFRSATLATGTPVIDSLQAALSITVASSNTMGCSSNIACRIWIYAIDNGGTVVIGLMTCSNTTTISSCNDDLLYNTASGTSGGSSIGVLYASTGSLAGKAVRIIGYLEATEVTAGTWATAPSKIQIFGPGMKKPGDVVQTVYVTTTISTTGPTSSTARWNTSLSGSITPTSAINLVKVAANGMANVNQGAGNSAIFQLYRGTNATGIGNLSGFSQAALPGLTSIVIHGFVLDAPQSASAVTYGLYGVCPTAQTVASVWLPATSGMGATLPTDTGELIMEEIMGAIELANDNGAPRAMAG